MKIRIGKGTGATELSLPTKLLFNRLTLRMILEKGKGSDLMEGLSPKAGALVKLLEQEKKRRGPWTLVEVDSADGEHIEVIL